MITRRRFVKLGVSAGFAAAVSSRLRVFKVLRAQIPGGTLPPGDVDKYVLPLVKPPAMPASVRNRNQDFYRIAVRQFRQRVISRPHPLTTVWSYGSIDYPGTVLTGGTFNYPAFTIESVWNKRTRVQWRNQLVDGRGNYLSHLLPVDPTLHWANPPGGIAGRDERPSFSSTPGPYTGPVPIVTHLHGR